MNKKLIKYIFIYVFFCIISICSVTLNKVYASDINDVYSNNLNEESPETLAVTLVIDNSGSMAETDPQKLRETAANMFIDLLSPEDYLSIITFNTKEEIVVPMQEIQSNDNKTDFKNKLSQKIQASGDTDYLVAFNEAGKQLDTVNNGNIRKVILFLTDGEPDPNKEKKNDLVFMNSYMDLLWKEVGNLALNKYEVYSVGFSKEVNKGILERISNETKGSIKISDKSSELALSFFDILGNLKNRKSLIDETFELKDKADIEFDLDEYTSQATMVLTNLNSTSFDVNISAPANLDANKLIKVNKFDKYNIITINKQNEKLTGKWKVNLIGNGKIKAFGNKDLCIKPWITSPAVNSLHPLNEPLEITVKVTGEVKNGISVEATITKNGNEDKNLVNLEFVNGFFKGNYENVSEIGNYDIEVKLIINGQIISSNKSSFLVKKMPVISMNFMEKDAKCRLGDKRLITSSLLDNNEKLLSSKELKIDNYNLILNYENNGSEIIPILDNGLTETGDIKENDGIWSGKVLFNKEDSGSASVMVKGIYKGEPFVLEKYLGDFKVYPVGNLIVKPLKSNLYTTINNQLKIPLEIENNSNFSETVIFNMDKDIGKIAQDRIKIEPLSKSIKYIYVNLDNNLKKDIYTVKINIEAEDKEIKVEPEQFAEEIEIVSKTGYILRYINEHKEFIIGCIGIIGGLFILIVSFGLLLYRFLVYKNRIIQGKFIYWKESDNDLKDKMELKFNQFKKSKLLITFNEENETAEYKIYSNKYNYDIELTAVASKSRWKFVDGYKALFNKNTVSELLIKTTKPGILIYEGSIYTSKKIYNKDTFITGEYVFQYFPDRINKSPDKDKGKNILQE